MYKVSLNTTKKTLSQRAAMSTNARPRQAGMSKLMVGGLALSAAGVAYYQHYQKDNDFYNGHPDPYAKHESKEAVRELGKAGDHLKNSAGHAADAARSSLSTAKDQIRDEAQSFVSTTHVPETQRDPNRGGYVENKLKTVENDVKDDVKKAEHFLTTKDVHDPRIHDEAEAFKATRHVPESTRDPNRTALLAEDKFKELEKDAEKKISGFFGSHKTTEHNPMVNEKLNTNKTKTDREIKLEQHAQQNVRDTTPLVSKDTDKVKPVWDDKKKTNIEQEIKSGLEDTTHSVMNTTSALGHGIKSSIYSLFGANPDPVQEKFVNGRERWESRLGAENVLASRTDQDIIDATKPGTPGKKGTSFDFYGVAETEGNPMVQEKLNKNKTKPLWETSLEEHAQEVVRDTSTLVDKDTQKVRQGVWDAKINANDKSSGAINYKAPKESFWSSLFGSHPKEHVEQEVKDDWKGLKNKAEETKDDVKTRASNSWEQAKHKASDEATRVKDDVNSTVNDLSQKSKQETSRLESGWNSLKNEVSHDAEYARQKAEDAASSISGKFRNETNKAEREVKAKTQEAKDEGNYLARRASNEVGQKAEEVKDESARLARRASDTISTKAQEAKDETLSLTRTASNQIYQAAENVKEKAEDTAKGLYQKGTNQVKSAKQIADQDIHWAKDKLDDGVENVKSSLTDAKDEVGRLFGTVGRDETGYTGSVVRGEKFAEDEAGQLRATRQNVERKPAEVVVEEANSKTM